MLTLLTLDSRLQHVLLFYNKRSMEKYTKEISLPRKLLIKFGEEYSSVYYIIIHVLLFYEIAEQIL